MARWTICPSCQGTGSLTHIGERDTMTWTCGRCEGKGNIQTELPVNELEKRAIKEWWRLKDIETHARRERLHDVLASTLTAMNTISKILGYEPDDDNWGKA